MKFAQLLILFAFVLAGCGQPSSEAAATTIAMAVQLTSLAEVSAATEEATPTPTETGVATSTETEAPTATQQPAATETDSPTATPTPYQVPDWPLFRSGDEGPEVFALQHLLRANGHNLVVDGKFGPQTRSRVTIFQQNENLAADGIVGPNTWAALIDLPLVKENSTGQAVRAVQRLLNDKFGYANVNVDGDFGPLTDAALRDFQQSYDLQVDGIVGPQTWQALIAIKP